MINWKQQLSYKPMSAKRKRLAVVFGIIMAIALAAIWITPSFINVDNYRKLLEQESKRLTGQTLQIKGSLRMELVPTPQLSAKIIELGGTATSDTGAPAPLLSAEEIIIAVPWSALFTDDAKIESITIVNPVLEVEKQLDGSVNWDWLTLDNKSVSLPAAISVKNGKLFYVNKSNNEVQEIRNVSLDAETKAGGMAIQGQFQALEQPIRLNAFLTQSNKLNIFTKAKVDLVHSPKTRLNFTLERTQTKNKVQWSGSGTADIENPGFWIELAGGDTKIKRNTSMPQINTEEVVEAPPAPYPVHFESALSYADGTLQLEELVLKTPDSTGKGKATITPGPIWNTQAALEFKSLKISQPVINELIRKYAVRQGAAGTITFSESQSRIPEHTQLSFSLHADSVMFGPETFQNLTLQCEIDEGTFRINRLSGSMAQDSNFALTGRVVDTAKGLRFQGRTQTGGSSLKNLLALFDPSAIYLPDTGFGAYYIESNIFVSSEQMRLSEAEVQVGELNLIGGLVTYFEQVPRMEAEISLKDTDLDYFRDTWREEMRQNNTGDFIFRVNSKVDFAWLTQLRPIIDLKINFDRFNFLQQTGTKGSFRLNVSQNELQLNNISLEYPHGTLKGTVEVTVDDRIPHMNVDLEIPILDTNYFSVDGESLGNNWILKDEEDRWSKNIFDFSWMIGLSADIKLALRRLTHHGVDYDRFLLESILEEEQMRFSRLTFERFGGKFEITGSLIGGKVPGLSSNFTVYNASLTPFLNSFSDLDNLNGRVSVSGTLATSGINVEEWVKQADAKLAIAARGVRVEGFNLPGVVDAVYASQSVADVTNNVERTIENGVTTLSIDGNINIQNGVVRTPGLSINTGEAMAILNGELRLIPWKMAANAVFEMKMLKSETTPTLTVDVSGTPDEYEMSIDTSSLEAFVAKRVVGR